MLVTLLYSQYYTPIFIKNILVDSREGDGQKLKRGGSLPRKIIGWRGKSISSPWVDRRYPIFFNPLNRY